jgi:hypothetical protein
MGENRNNAVKLASALAILAVAGVLFWRYAQDSAGDSEKSFFYDLSERKLFVAARSAIPPIRGVNDAQADGVRAVVVSTNGRPEAKATWRVAYLETNTPELKQDLENARAAGTPPAIGRGAAQQFRLVKRPDDRDWVSLATPEGEQIVAEWTTWGGDQPPVVCNP